MLIRLIITMVLPMINIEGKVVQFEKVAGGHRSLQSRGLKISETDLDFSSHSLRFAKMVDTKSSENSDDLTSVEAIYYVGPLVVGDQTFQVIYDTGSNLVWVPGPACGSECGSHSTYTGVSTSADQDFDLMYGSGPVSGVMVYAPVTLADASLSSFKLGLADEVGFSGYTSSEFEGILGLAWPGLNSDLNVPAIVPALFAANEIAGNLFTIYLSADGSGGELNLGEIDSTRYQGEISWMPLVRELWWSVHFVDLTIGSAVSTATASSGLAIIDSGTSLIIGPTDAIYTLMDSIQTSTGIPVYFDSSQQIFAVLCEDVPLLPDLSFLLAGADGQSYKFTMPGASYVVSTLTSDPSICPLGLQGSDSLEGASSGSVSWILGDPFLRTFYTIYDYAGERVGVAAAFPSAGTTIPGDLVKGAVFLSSAAAILAVLILL